MFLGHVFINKNKQNIFCTSQLLYYALTTLSKLQTLGEEYTKIVQVGKTGKHVPGLVVIKMQKKSGIINNYFCSPRMLLLIAKHWYDINPCIWRQTYHPSLGSFD
jgi:hypothetical protein